MRALSFFILTVSRSHDPFHGRVIAVNAAGALLYWNLMQDFDAEYAIISVLMM